MQVGYRILAVDGGERTGEIVVEVEVSDDLDAAQKAAQKKFNDKVRAVIEDALDDPEADLERVRVFQNDRYTDMFVDERGHHKGLPINPRATEVYLNNVKVHDPAEYRKALKDGTCIAGTAILFDRPVW